jgi:hypothetical protein
VSGPPSARRASALAAFVAAAAGAVAAPAWARTGVRPIFEPTDLELEVPGVMEVDLQVGAIRSQGPARAVIPDFELDLGILPSVELDLDGAYAIEGPAQGPFAFDHAAPDSLWLSAKVGFFDWSDDQSKSAWAVGMQAGPKAPVAAGAHGLGAEALFLIGHMRRNTHAILNAGGFVDPAPDAASGRPVGVEVGLDLQREVTAGGGVSLTAELSGVRFLTSDPHQLLATAGVTLSPSESLDLSVVGLWGFLAGSDRYGVLVGLSPKLRLWRRR